MKTPTPEQIQRLIAASIAYVERCEKHFAAQAQRAKDMQTAANLARQGRDLDAKQIMSRLQLTAVQMPNYEDVLRDLTKAVKPFRNKAL